MTALPANVYPPGLFHDAYDGCLALEMAAHGLPDPRSHSRNVMHARILGYLIRKVPTPQGRHAIASEVASCLDDNSMSELAMLYLNHFIRCCP